MSKVSILTVKVNSNYKKNCANKTSVMAQRFDQFDSQLLIQIKTQSNLDEIKLIIKNENMYKATDFEKNTLLHHAGKCGNHKVVRYLIKSGSRIDSRNIYGETPIMTTIVNMNCEKTEYEKRYSEQMEILKTLVEAGAHIYPSKNHPKSALQVIGQNGRLTKETLQLFLKKMKIDCTNDNNKISKKLFDAAWSLYKVIQLGDVGLTKVMLQDGMQAEINAVSGKNKTVLHLAIEETDLEHVKLLLKYNANLNALDFYKRKPLWYVYEYKNQSHSNEKLEILKILLERNYLPTKLIQHEDIRQVQNIFSFGNADAIELLFQHIDPYIVDYDRHYDEIPNELALNANPGTIEQLKNRRFNVNARSKFFNETPLITAARVGNINAVKFLLDKGANIDDVDIENCTALFSGIKRRKGPKERRRECIQSLLEHGANVQLQTLDRYYTPTVLDAVVWENCFSLGELVLAHLALEEMQGTTITQLIQNKIDSNDRFKGYFKSSKQLLKMQTYQSITLFDLLTVTEKRLECYACNQDFVFKIEKFISSLAENYYFYHRLQKRISKANEMVRLKHEGAPIVGEILKTSYQRFPHVIDEILDYLEQRDMQNLINTFVE